tara:strand:+ start:581 stop:1300 length:720 start_codon:yes stop_codon:yes gene_type:complete
MKQQIIKIGNISLKVEVALTKEEQEKGLKNRNTLPDNQGMLFSYPDEKFREFWMKNTAIPLSIAFIDKDKKITEIVDMEPYNEKTIKSKSQAKWALEVNKGWFKKNNISVGDKIILGKSKINIKILTESDPKIGTGKKPKGSGRRLYTDENPKDTVSVKFSTVSDIRDTFSKASFKSKSHKRQSQIINLVHQRVRAAYRNAKDPKVKARLKKAYDYAKKRKEASKKKTKKLNNQRKKGK